MKINHHSIIKLLAMKDGCELIQKELILGINTDVHSIHVLNRDQILYSCGNHVVIWQRKDQSQIFIHQCQSTEERITSLCHAKKTLAIAIVGEEGAYIVLYDTTTYRRKKVLRHKDETLKIIGMSFSRDGKWCLVLGDEPAFQLSLWDIEKVPKILVSIGLATPSGKQIRRADLCPSDNRLVCVSGNGILRFFRITSDSQVFRPVTVQLKNKPQNYLYHCWLSSGKVILATAEKELILVQNFEEKVVVPIFKWDRQSVTSICPLGESFMIGGGSGSIRLYHCTDEEGASIQAIKDIKVVEDANILAFDSFVPDNFVVCLLGTGKICNIDIDVMAEAAISRDLVPSFHRRFDGESSIICMDTCAWKSILATGGSDKILRIWNFKMKKFDLIHSCDEEIMSISLHPMSFQILVCCKTYVALSDIMKNKLSQLWRMDIQTNGSCCFSNGGQFFAIPIGNFVQIYNTFTHEVVNTLRGHSAQIISISWKSNDVNVATIGSDGVICVWNSWTGERIFRLSNEGRNYYNGFLTEDFGTAMMNTREGIELIDVQSNSPRETKGCDIFRGSKILFYSNDIIVGSKEVGEFWIMNIGNDSCSNTLHPVASRSVSLHSKDISCVTISSHHEYIFTGGIDGLVCISKLNHRLFPQKDCEYIEDIGKLNLNDVAL